MTKLTQYTKQFVRYLRHNKAVSALEYAILVGAIAIAVVVALNQFGGNIKQSIQNIGTQVENKVGQTKLKNISPQTN